MKMRKTITRIMSLASAMLLVLSLAACVDKPSQGGETTTDVAATVNTDVDETTSSFVQDSVPDMNLGTTIGVLAWNDVEHFEFNDELGVEKSVSDLVLNRLASRLDTVQKRLGIGIEFIGIPGDAGNLANWNAYVEKAMQGGDKSFDFGFVFVTGFYGNDVAVCGVSAFQSESVFHGIETGVNGEVGVDDGIVHILKNVGELSRFNFFEFEVVGVVGNIGDGSGDAGFFIQGDVTEFLEEEQSAGFVGGVVGNGNGKGGVFFIAAAAGGEADKSRNSQGQSEDNCNKFFHGSVSPLIF